MPDHRGHWPTAEGPASSPPFIPPQNINLNITVNLGPEAATLLRGMNSEVLAAIKGLGTKMAKTLDDILSQGAVALQKATDNTNALQAFKGLLDADVQTITDLRAQLAEAMKNQNDPAKLQALADTMDAIIAQADTQAAAEAALSGTPAAPPDEPAPASA